MARRGYGPSAGEKISEDDAKKARAGAAMKKRKKGVLGKIGGAGASALGVTFNVLDKPGQAIRSGLARTAEASYKGKSPLNALGAFATGAGRGLVGKDHTSFSEIAGAATEGDRTVAKKLPFGVDTLGSIATDPTSYLTLGASAAGKQAARTAAETLGEATIKSMAKKGAKRALTTAEKDTLRSAIASKALAEGRGAISVEKAAKIADKQMKALARTGRGGVKFAGHSVPGLTAESRIGQAASKVNPKTVVGQRLGATKGGRTIKDAFIKGGGDVQHAFGEDIARDLRKIITETGDKTTLKQAERERIFQNLYKAAAPDDERMAEVLRAVDISPEVRTAREAAQEAEKAAIKAERTASGLAGRNDQISAKVREVLTEKRQALLAAKEAVERAAAAVDGSVETRAALTQARKVARIAADDLERTAEKWATSAERQGVSQMAGHASIDADLAKAAAEEAKAAIPKNTKEAIAAMRARGDDALADLTEYIDNTRSEITERQVSAGLLTKGIHDTEEYVPRYFTKEGLKALEDLDGPAAIDALSSGRKVTGGQLKGAIHQGEAGLRRLRPDLSIDELNDLFTKPIHGLDEGVEGPSLPALLKPGVKAVQDNPIAAMARRSHSAEAAVNHVDMVKRVATDLKGPDGKPLLREIEKGADPSPGMDALDLIEDAGVRYEGDPAIIKMLNEARAVTVNDKGWKALSDHAGNVTRVWRSMATFGPAFHARNEAGNLWLNYLANVRNPKHYLHAAKLQKAAAGAFKALDGGTGLDAAIAGLKVSDADKAIIKAAFDEGVLTHGFFAEDLVKTPLKLGGKRSAKEKALAPLSKANEANKAAGSAIENNARLAHFISKIDELGSTKAAAESVKKFLFDYSDLTSFEKHLKNVAIPFYTFMRKNTPLEIEQMILNPGKFTRYQHLAQDAQEHGFDEQPDVPVSSVEDILRPITGTSAKGNRTTSGLQRRAQGVVGPLNPLLKVGQSLASGASSYNGYPMRDTGALVQGAARDLLPIYSKVAGAGKKSWKRNLLGFNDLSAPEDKKAGAKRGSGKKTPRRSYG